MASLILSRPNNGGSGGEHRSYKKHVCHFLWLILGALQAFKEERERRSKKTAGKGWGEALPRLSKQAAGPGGQGLEGRAAARGRWAARVPGHGAGRGGGESGGYERPPVWVTGLQRCPHRQESRGRAACTLELLRGQVGLGRGPLAGFPHGPLVPMGPIALTGSSPGSLGPPPGRGLAWVRGETGPLAEAGQTPRSLLTPKRVGGWEAALTEGKDLWSRHSHHRAPHPDPVHQEPTGVDSVSVVCSVAAGGGGGSPGTHTEAFPSSKRHV